MSTNSLVNNIVKKIHDHLMKTVDYRILQVLHIMYVKAAQRQRSIFHICFQHNDKKRSSLFIEKKNI